MICDTCADTACPIRRKYPNACQCLQYKPIPFKTLLEVAAKPWTKHLLEEIPLAKGEPVPTEDAEQMRLFQWAINNLDRYPDLYWMIFIPNGGNLSKAQSGRFKAMGLKPGVSDIFLPIPRGKDHGLWIEMKRLKNSKVSDKQLEWRAGMEAQGYRAVIRKGWRAAANAIILYLNGELEADE